MKKIIVPLLVAVILTAAVAAPAAQKADQKPAPKVPNRVAIPKEVKEPMEAGMAAKTARLDIPFEIFRTQFLPAQQGFHQVFFMKIKNADLGFAPVPASAVIDPAVPLAPAKVKAVVNVFVQFHQVENGVAGKLIKEIYVPASFEADQAGFNPEQSDWYTIGYPLMPGEYLASIAICSQDLSKIGIQYCDVKLPDPKSFTSALDTTPLFFIKSLQQVQAPDKTTAMHRGFFSYGVGQITPNLDNVFTVGETLDLFTYVFGCQPKTGNEYDIEITIEVDKGSEPAIKFASGNFNSTGISLPLIPKQTLQIKQGDQVRTETRDLPAGSYTFVMKMKDKISGNVGEKKIDIIVK